MNVLTVIVLLLVSGSVSPLTLYCPSANDLVVAYTSCGNCDVDLQNRGWTIRGQNGGAGVATKSSFNLENGYVSYTINLGSVNYYVNANIYGIFPSGIGSSGFNNGLYCDAQKTGSSWCPELDFIESNGHCAGGTTVHTISGTPGGCDNNGCQATYNLASSSLNMNITFSSTGIPTHTASGASIGTLNPTISGTGSVLNTYFTTKGVVLYSSLWQNWSPTTSTCTTSSSPWGTLSGSSFSISNLQIYGTVVQGPTPTLCSGSAPPPPPPTTPKPTSPATPKPTTPAPSTCNFNVNLAGKQCKGLTQKTGVTSQSACQSACCSTSGCKVWQWWTSNSQCWIGGSSTKLTTSNCPANSGSFVSFSTTALSSAAEVSDAVKTNYPYIIGGVVILVILVVAIVFVLRSKARRRGQTMSDYVRESVANPKPTEHVPLESTPSASVLPQQETPVEAPMIPTNNEWEQRVDETSGQTFYYNVASGATQWETPDGYLAPTATAS